VRERVAAYGYLDSNKEDPGVNFRRDIEEAKERASVGWREVGFQESIGEEHLYRMG
jgi:hypothetical protein